MSTARALSLAALSLSLAGCSSPTKPGDEGTAGGAGVDGSATGSGAGADALVGGLLGLATAIGVGLAIFVGGARVNLRQFFTITGAVLIFVAAGLVAFAVGALGEAGLIVNNGIAYNLNGVLPDSTPLGNVLRGLFGYRSQPTPLEVAAYLLYLIPVLTLFVVGRPSLRRGAVATG